MNASVENPTGVPAPFGNRFAHVARIDMGPGSLLILAGQVGVDDDGEVMAPGDATVQSQRIFELIGSILGAYGGTLGNVLHIRTFMTNLDDLPAYGAVRRELFPTNPPASTTVEVSRLFLSGAVIEVEVTAYVPS